MLFNSLEFIIFFALVVLVYFCLAQRVRWIFLLVASYYFYMCWKPEYIILIIISTLIDYIAGMQIGKTSDKKMRRRYLSISLIANLGLLFSFKYFNFFNDSLRGLFQQFNICYGIQNLDVLLPVGISFYTFQTLSYTIDVYRGNKQPEKHLGFFALYVAFFPQLVAGPIERSTRLLPQFFQKHEFDYKRVTDGLKLMCWGFFQKVVIADRLAIIVDHIYNQPMKYQGLPLLIATYFFAVQIYCDFSGYTDIARGAAKVMGYELMNNFKRPYFAKSIREFWQRWHISLSSWFRDYVYIPLGGNNNHKWRWIIVVMVVFLVSGLWHGAAWTFVIWGGLHGIYYLGAVMTKNIRARFTQTIHLDNLPRLQKYLKVFITFHLVLFSWIFFRANSLRDASYIVKQLCHFRGISAEHLAHTEIMTDFLGLGVGLGEFVLAVAIIGMLVMIHLAERKDDLVSIVSSKPLWVRWAVYITGTLAIMNLGITNNIPFIYFQF